MSSSDRETEFDSAFTALTKYLQQAFKAEGLVSIPDEIIQPFRKSCHPTKSALLIPLLKLFEANHKQNALRLDPTSFSGIVSITLHFAASPTQEKLIHSFMGVLLKYKNPDAVVETLKGNKIYSLSTEDVNKRYETIIQRLLHGVLQRLTSANIETKLRWTIAQLITVMLYNEQQACERMCRYEERKYLTSLLDEGGDYVIRFLVANLLRYLLFRGIRYDTFWNEDLRERIEHYFPADKSTTSTWLTDTQTFFNNFDQAVAFDESRQRCFEIRKVVSNSAIDHHKLVDITAVISDDITLVVPDGEQFLKLVSFPILSHLDVCPTSSSDNEEVTDTVELKYLKNTGYALCDGKRSAVDVVSFVTTSADEAAGFINMIRNSTNKPTTKLTSETDQFYSVGTSRLLKQSVAVIDLWDTTDEATSASEGKFSEQNNQAGSDDYEMSSPNPISEETSDGETMGKTDLEIESDNAVSERMIQAEPDRGTKVDEQPDLTQLIEDQSESDLTNGANFTIVPAVRLEPDPDLEQNDCLTGKQERATEEGTVDVEVTASEPSAANHLQSIVSHQKTTRKFNQKLSPPTKSDGIHSHILTPQIVNRSTKVVDSSESREQAEKQLASPMAHDVTEHERSRAKARAMASESAEPGKKQQQNLNSTQPPQMIKQVVPATEEFEIPREDTDTDSSYGAVQTQRHANSRRKGQSTKSVPQKTNNIAQKGGKEVKISMSRKQNKVPLNSATITSTRSKRLPRSSKYVEESDSTSNGDENSNNDAQNALQTDIVQKGGLLRSTSDGKSRTAVDGSGTDLPHGVLRSVPEDQKNDNTEIDEEEEVASTKIGMETAKETLKTGHKNAVRHFQVRRSSPPATRNSPKRTRTRSTAKISQETVVQDSYPEANHNLLKDMSDRVSFGAELEKYLVPKPKNRSDDRKAPETPFGNTKKFIRDVNSAKRSKSPQNGGDKAKEKSKLVHRKYRPKTQEDAKLLDVELRSDPEKKLEASAETTPDVENRNPESRSTVKVSNIEHDFVTISSDQEVGHQVDQATNEKQLSVAETNNINENHKTHKLASSDVSIPTEYDNETTLRILSKESDRENSLAGQTETKRPAGFEVDSNAENEGNQRANKALAGEGTNLTIPTHLRKESTTEGRLVSFKNRLRGGQVSPKSDKVDLNVPADHFENLKMSKKAQAEAKPITNINNEFKTPTGRGIPQSGQTDKMVTGNISKRTSIVHFEPFGPANQGTNGSGSKRVHAVTVEPPLEAFRHHQSKKIKITPGDQADNISPLHSRSVVNPQAGKISDRDVDQPELEEDPIAIEITSDRSPVYDAHAADLTQTRVGSDAPNLQNNIIVDVSDEASSSQDSGDEDDSEYRMSDDVDEGGVGVDSGEFSQDWQHERSIRIDNSTATSKTQIPSPLTGQNPKQSFLNMEQLVDKPYPQAEKVSNKEAFRAERINNAANRLNRSHVGEASLMDIPKDNSSQPGKNKEAVEGCQIYLDDSPRDADERSNIGLMGPPPRKYQSGAGIDNIEEVREATVPIPFGLGKTSPGTGANRLPQPVSRGPVRVKRETNVLPALEIIEDLRQGTPIPFHAQIEDAARRAVPEKLSKEQNEVIKNVTFVSEEDPTLINEEECPTIMKGRPDEISTAGHDRAYSETSDELSPTFRNSVSKEQNPNQTIRPAQMRLYESFIEVAQDVLFRFGEEEDAILAKVDHFYQGVSTVIRDVSGNWTDRINHEATQVRNQIGQHRSDLERNTLRLQKTPSDWNAVLRLDEMKELIRGRNELLTTQVAGLKKLASL